MLSRISSIKKNLDCVVCVTVDFVCVISSDVREFFIKSFYFVYVSDDCFSAKRMILFCCVSAFCWIVLLWCTIWSVNFACDQFRKDVVFMCLFCVHVFICLCVVKSNDF